MIIECSRKSKSSAYPKFELRQINLDHIVEYKNNFKQFPINFFTNKNKLNTEIMKKKFQKIFNLSEN
jgi:hypothetical protein